MHNICNVLPTDIIAQLDKPEKNVYTRRRLPQPPIIDLP